MQRSRMDLSLFAKLFVPKVGNQKMQGRGNYHSMYKRNASHKVLSMDIKLATLQMVICFVALTVRDKVMKTSTNNLISTALIAGLSVLAASRIIKFLQ